MNIVITGGGTGGHLSIVKALKEEFNKKNIKPIYIGSTHGQDIDWFENDDGFSQKYFLESSGVVNKKGIKKIKSLFNILNLSMKCKKIFQEKDIKAIISVGGYSAAPASFAATFSNRALFIHEQNAVYGRLNKILSPFSKRVFCSFLPPYDPYPVSDIFFDTKRVRENIKTVIFLGGSQGAKEINDIALKIAPKLHERGINIIHQTGKKDFVRVKKEYEKLKIDADIFDFDKNIFQKMQKADFAVARAGASTLWELASNLLPTIFIPYPYAANNHQFFNAKFLEKQNCAFLYDRDKDYSQILDVIEKQDISKISKNLEKIVKKDGAKKIVEEILDSIK
ncbi:UDP-N-acetylglucosamine--N-acetylmuramyl-(pentapeptide) pyrophosphoryl-undecaprenol N-acetylglucosamine transferase [Nitrosophilus kaiyonis]|uniref:UDP-N-acetylglucosamine--N-acetylmuramyl- (pentapeptide) pyrophosphoryl-undecaprenol N-acetylglucosamine transferase n=1 Tax=Nitrosophilus kaiyonis TaxID=2930200 RepID=UPI00248FCF3E|nr:UDP-N-acetylglucosamine--N-acetylmuramyl-(pentapeptide) pyrophosphoryl-undecaprenol N-acetylglucosamine transferase [Nitrosophilus kaiyonis]